MGTTPQKTHDAKMFVPNLGEYHSKKIMIWYSTQGDHTNHGGYKAILPMSRQEANLFKSTQGATYVIKKVGSQYINVILIQVQTPTYKLMGH